MSTIKLLLMLPSEGHGGCEYNALSTIHYLRSEKAMDVAVALPRSPGMDFIRQLCERNDIRHVNFEVDFASRDSAAIVETHRSRTRAVVLSEKPDAVFIPLPWPKRGQGVILGCSDLAVPTLVKFALVPPELGPQDFVSPDLASAIHRRQHWFANSRYSAQLLEKHWRLPARSVDFFHVGPVGLARLVKDGAAGAPAGRDATLRSELGIGPEATIVTTVARFSPQKGYKFLMRAAERTALVSRKIVFVWVGGGEMQGSIGEWVGRNKLSDVVKMVGFRTDVRSILAQSDIFVLPTLYEGGCSQVLLEAMEAGLPIVATDTSAVSEVARADVSALLVPPGDGGGLCHALLRLVFDAELRERLSRQARQDAAKFSAALNFENTFARLSAVLSMREGAGPLPDEATRLPPVP